MSENNERVSDPGTCVDCGHIAGSEDCQNDCPEKYERVTDEELEQLIDKTEDSFGSRTEMVNRICKELLARRKADAELTRVRAELVASNKGAERNALISRGLADKVHALSAELVKERDRANKFFDGMTKAESELDEKKEVLRQTVVQLGVMEKHADRLADALENGDSEYIRLPQVKAVLDAYRKEMGE